MYPVFEKPREHMSLWWYLHALKLYLGQPIILLDRSVVNVFVGKRDLLGLLSTQYQEGKIIMQM